MHETMTDESFKNKWDKIYTGEKLSTKSKNVGGFEARFNPLRAKYMVSTQHAAIDTDVFCHKWERILSNEKISEVKLEHYQWALVVNTSPIENYHSLLICGEHQNQELSLESMEDLFTFSTKYPSFSVGFNGWRAGASQKHLHAQLFLSQLPIVRWDKRENTELINNYPGICLTYKSVEPALNVINELISRGTPYNVLFYRGEIYIIPRKNENDVNNVKRGFDSVFGKIPLLTESDYDQITLEGLKTILNTLTHQSLKLNEKQITV